MEDINIKALETIEKAGKGAAIGEIRVWVENVIIKRRKDGVLFRKDTRRVRDKKEMQDKFDKLQAEHRKLMGRGWGMRS